MALKTVGDAIIYFGMVIGALTTIGIALRYMVWKPLLGHLGRMFDQVLGQVEHRLDGLEKQLSDHITTHRK